MKHFLFGHKLPPQESKGSTQAFFYSRLVRRLFTVLAFATPVAILGYLVYRQKDILLTYHWQLDWRLLPLFLGLFTINILLVTWVWVKIIHEMGVNLDFMTHFRYFTISNLVKRLPGTVWYVAWRAQTYGPEGLSLQLTSLASGVELAILIISCSLVSLVFAIPIFLRYRVGIGGAVVLLFLSLSFLHPRVLNWLLKLTHCEPGVIGYRQLLRWIGVYILTRLSSGIMLFCVANIFTPLSFQHLAYVIGSDALVGALSTALLFAPTNFGFTEIGLSLLLSAIMPSSIAVVIAIAGRILDISGEMLLALVAVVISSIGRKKV